MTTKRKKGETHLVEWKESWRDEYLKWLCAPSDLILYRSPKGVVKVGAMVRWEVL